MRVLVTGGAGLIGSHIVDRLLERGDDVVILDNLEPTTHPNGTPPWVPTTDARLFVGDVRNRAHVEQAMVGCELVFHQAAFGGFAPDAGSLMTATNALGTVNVMEAAAKAGVSRVVVASSQAVYGYGAGDCPEHGEVTHLHPRRVEDLERGYWEPRCPVLIDGWTVQCDNVLGPAKLEGFESPETIYGLSKLYEERAALMLGDDYSIPTVALRYALTYGPRQSTSNPYTGICSIFATRLVHGLRPVLFEDGEQERDFTFVEDVAAANIAVADEPSIGGELNVGTGVGTTVGDFAKLLQAELGGRGAILTGEYRLGDARHMVCDATKLRELTGWRPTVTVEQGVKRYVEWFLENKPDRVVDAGRELRDAGVIQGGGAE